MEIKNNIKKAVQSVGEIQKAQYFRPILIATILMAWTLIVLQVGIFVGFKKASYSFKFADKYYKGFRGPDMDDLSLFKENSMPRSHGSIGRVIEVNLPTITVADKDGLEKTILINNKTLIKRFEADASSTDIKIDDFAVVIGAPNDDSQINARFIRVVPQPLEVPLQSK